MDSWEKEIRRLWAVIGDLRKRIKNLEEKVRYIETEQPAGPERSGGPLLGGGLTDRLFQCQDGK